MKIEKLTELIIEPVKWDDARREFQERGRHMCNVCGKKLHSPEHWLSHCETNK